jgi:hypothetical protein
VGLSFALGSSQLSLFAWRPLPSPTMHTSPVERTPEQLLRSAAAWCEWRSGISWRRSADRWNSDRMDYLRAAGLLRDLIFVDVRPQVVFPRVEVMIASPREQELAQHTREELVDALLEADRRLTDRKLLMRLPPKKLANMLAELPDARRNQRRA